MKLKELLNELKNYDTELDVCIYSDGQYIPLNAVRFNAGKVLLFK